MEGRTPLRSYSKSELAHLYNPGCPYESAVKLLRKWIKLNPALLKELDETYYNPKTKILSPRQVEIIFKHLGEP